MKYKSLILKILAGIFLAIAIIYLTLNSGNKIDIQIEQHPTINKPLQIDVTITKNLQNFNPEKVDIKFYNKYNKSERIESTLENYDEGKYSILVTPNYSGEYTFEISVSNKNDLFSKSQTFTVKE